MTICGQCWGQVKSAIVHARLMYARYVYAWVMCCTCYYSNSVCKSGEPGAVCSQLAAWRPVCSSTGLYALRLDSTEWPIAWSPSRQGHSRFWCYSDQGGAYGLMLCVIWPPVLITVSGALIPERNGLSQFNEDTGKPSVPVRKFNLRACPPA